jgi:hypothetical protein
VSTFTFEHETHTFRNSKGQVVPSVTQVLKRAGLIAEQFYERADPNAKTLGENVHWATSLVDKGRAGLVMSKAGRNRNTHSIKPYVRCWTEWKQRTGFTPVYVEHEFVSRYGYAGIVDRFGFFPDKSFAVVDLKTGHTIPPWVRYQLVGYVPEFGGVLAIRRFAVRLRSTGPAVTKEYEPDTAATDWAQFMKYVKEYR